MNKKISDIITQVDELKPNKYSSAVKLGWFNDVDGMIWNEIYKYTGFSDILRQQGKAAYDLPEGVGFELILKVFVEGQEIYPITFEDFETTGYFRGSDGKLNIYPVPTSNDVSAGLREVHRLPFTAHASVDDFVYMPAPYDKGYIDYLSAMIDKYNQEMDGYNNNLGFFNGNMKDYADWYTKHKQEG